MISVILGRANPQIKMYRHDENPVFGTGKNKEEHFWNSLLRQMLLENIIQKDIEDYGVLKISKKGEGFLKKPLSFKIVLNHIFEENGDDEDEAADNDEAIAIGGEVGIKVSDDDTEGALQTKKAGDVIILRQGERHRLIGLSSWGIIAEIWQHTDENNPSNEEDIVRVQDDFGR